MKKILFRSVLKFTFKGNHFEMFKTNDEKVAFLKINNNKYEYPSIEEFRDLTSFFGKHKNILGLQKYSFMPSLKANIKGKAKIVALSSMLVLKALTTTENVYAIENDYVTVEDDGEYVLTEEDYEYLETLFANLNNDYKIILDNNEPEILENTKPDIFNQYTIPEGIGIIKDNGKLINSLDLNDSVHVDLGNIDAINDTEHKQLELLNSKYFDVFFREENYELSEINIIIDNNIGIPNEFKNFIKDFSYGMIEYYPGLDTRVYAENLKTLKIFIDDPKNFYEDMESYYNTNDNTIHLKNNFNIDDLTSKTYLRHELGHLFNNIKITRSNYQVEYSYYHNTHGMFLMEALNVLFTSKPFKTEYENQNINKGYDVLEGITKIFTEAINFNYNDFVTKNVYDFEKQLDSKSGINTKFNHIEDIFECIWDDYVTIPYLGVDNEITDDFSIDASYKKEFFSYVTQLYINHFINNEMTLDEFEEKRNEFIETICNNTEDKSVFDFDTINDIFDNYKINNMIESNRKNI